MPSSESHRHPADTPRRPPATRPDTTRPPLQPDTARKRPPRLPLQSPRAAAAAMPNGHRPRFRLTGCGLGRSPSMDHTSDSETTETHKRAYRWRLRRMSMRWRRAASAAAHLRAHLRAMRTIVGVSRAFLPGNVAFCIADFLHPLRPRPTHPRP